jgi:hypothetical protein
MGKAAHAKPTILITTPTRVFGRAIHTLWSITPVTTLASGYPSILVCCKAWRFSGEIVTGGLSAVVLMRFYSLRYYHWDGKLVVRRVCCLQGLPPRCSIAKLILFAYMRTGHVVPLFQCGAVLTGA